MTGTTLDIQEMIGYARGAVAVRGYSDCARAIGLLDGPDAAWKQWQRRRSQSPRRLDRERSSWASSGRSEARILAVVDSTVGMVGDLQCIAGKAMPEIPSLDMPLLEASTDREAKVS